MAVPTWSEQPLFLYALDAAEGFYVAVPAGFAAPATKVLNKGIYCLTSVGVDLTFAVAGVLDGTNGAHLPAGDTRMLLIAADATTLQICLAPGGATAGSINIAQVRPNPRMF